jgi:hypothetical protein
MPIATHLLIGHELPYRLMHGNWHRLAEMATKRHRHEQQCKATRRHPLSLADNIKIYFINNTCHFNVRLNYIINLYYVRLVCYFLGHHRRIGVMALSVMTQRRAIINDVLRCNLSPSQSHHTIPRLFQPPPPHTLDDCSVIEVGNRVVRSNLPAQLQIATSTLPPPRQKI